ncbi:prolyl oligopeptidase family serine peptidase [Asticcacaulis excentricus]|uniref:Dipeptidyl peptidase IV n=1 Tax=Asticcacaulis excentricus TaxID=78587 RepID=A0A3G9FYY6_9CAUL|nr:prolyl oligopeptidase family serine peptidase [Asticcacaulis excentricus]BBF80280.1 dipeptidyl peptidase IV [Asticcacaulis excentricus]
MSLRSSRLTAVASVAALCALASPVAAPAQTVPTPSGPTAVSEVFGVPTRVRVQAERFSAANVRALITDLDLRAKFTADGQGVIYRTGAKGAGRIWRVDLKTSGVSELATESTLTALLAAQGIKVDGGFEVSPSQYDRDKDILSIYAGGREWRYERITGKLSAAEKAPAETGVLSPDGKYRVISRNYNLWLVEVATGRETALTTDGVYDRRYGQNYPQLGDMVAANSETPDMRVSVQWSGDSRRLLTYRLDRNGSYIWHAVQPNPPGSRFPRTFSYVYPNAGAKDVPQVYPVVIDVAKALEGKPALTLPELPAQSLLWPGDPNLWFNETGKIVYEWQARGYTEVNLYEADPVTGKAQVRVHEALSPNVYVTSTAMRAAPELGGYLIISERSNWAQLYFLKDGDNPSGGRALTKGEWEVTGISHVAKGGPILITGIGRETGVNPYFRSLYKVMLDGKIINLTPEPLDHDITVSEDGQWVIDRMSTPSEPPRTVLRRASDGVIVLELGRADHSALLAAGFTLPEVFETTAEDGKTKLYGTIYRPAHFDPSKSYAVIENVYTGPTTHRFSETYGGNVPTNIAALAQLGAIVVTIDGTGTSQRGKAFRMPAWQNLGEVGLDDHIHVLKAMKAKYPYFDLDRVGVYGGSAGGYDTARFVLRRPDFYKVGVASSGNHDLRLDKAWWPETTMGNADDATWEKNSNISVAGNLKGHLMLIHGDIDDNVPVAATMRLSAALTAAGKPHDLVILPNTPHNVNQPYYWNRLTGYFYQHLIDAK